MSGPISDPDIPPLDLSWTYPDHFDELRDALVSSIRLISEDLRDGTHSRSTTESLLQMQNDFLLNYWGMCDGYDPNIMPIQYSPSLYRDI